MQAPQLAANIGAVARVMNNFGLQQLSVVAPRDGWPPAANAFAVAGKGAFILEQAKVFNSLIAAVADMHFVVAATVRPRGMFKEVLKPAAAGTNCWQHVNSEQKAAIVFGPENNGLANDEIALADAIVTIPNLNSSLNLAQAVAVMAYELMRDSQREIDVAAADVATKQERQRLNDALVQALTSKSYFKNEEHKELINRRLTSFLQKQKFSKNEISLIIGMIKRLVR